MSNRMIEQLGDGNFRETDFNAPAHETKNARFAQEGGFVQVDVAASQTDAVLTRFADGAPNPDAVTAGRKGRIVGIAARSNADLTAGSATFEPSINGTKVAGSAVLSDLVQQVAQDFAAVVFAKGDRLGIQLTTNAGFLPVTADVDADLLIEWDPE